MGDPAFGVDEDDGAPPTFPHAQRADSARINRTVKDKACRKALTQGMALQYSVSKWDKVGEGGIVCSGAVPYTTSMPKGV